MVDGALETLDLTLSKRGIVRFTFGFFVDDIDSFSKFSFFEFFEKFSRNIIQLLQIHAHYSYRFVRDAQNHARLVKFQVHFVSAEIVF